MNRIVSSLLVTGVLFLIVNSAFLGCNRKTLDAMPRWELQDMDGNVIHSKEFAGKIVVVNFWATWCQPCVQEIPGFVSLQQKYGKQGLTIVGIALDELGAQSVKPVLKQRGVNYTVLAGDTAIQLTFGGLDGLPTTFIFDRTGKLVTKHEGFWDMAALEKELQPLLERK
jgi:thiol-disulfide isomerase/thioredoxin